MIKRIEPGKRFCKAVVVNGIVTTAGVTGEGADAKAQTRHILDQIDALLAAKIDESVRKGYPRNRAELAGLSRTGAVSFGVPSAHPRSTEAQVEHDIKLAGGRANTLQNMFFARADQSGSRAA